MAEYKLTITGDGVSVDKTIDAHKLVEIMDVLTREEKPGDRAEDGIRDSGPWVRMPTSRLPRKR